MSKYKINIVHLYPELLNLYGDKGNIECLKKRLLWRNIDADVIECNGVTPEIDFENTDIIFLGGGAEREQEIVCKRLLNIKQSLKNYIEAGGTFIALCGGYELLCSDALGLLDIHCAVDKNKERLIGNVILDSDLIDEKIVGFENHAGRIDIGSYTSLGKVVVGFGNDSKSGEEGIVYKNLMASFLHGPLFPKNPALCDRLLENTLHHKYPDFSGLTPLDDKLEKKANQYMIKRLCK